MSRWKDIYSHLKKAGFEVYSPGQHQGECTSSYVVIKDAGATKLGGFSSTQATYDILCYVPGQHFSQLEPFVESVEAAMRGLYPMMRPAHFRTPSFYDDTVKGHMISTQYINYQKII
jgi:hypothetical protein